jgi:hypothetical protein
LTDHELSHVHLFVDTPAPALKAAPVPEWKEVRKRSRERRSLPKDMGESSFIIITIIISYYFVW